MTMIQLTRTLARVHKDLDTLAQEFNDRSFDFEWDRIEIALAHVGQVCNGFLDERTLEALGVNDVELEPRPVPGSAKGWREDELELRRARKRERERAHAAVAVEPKRNKRLAA